MRSSCEICILIHTRRFLQQALKITSNLDVLLASAQARWRRITGAELVPFVRAGATFIDGKLRGRRNTTAATSDDTEGVRRRLSEISCPRLLRLTPW
jgi:hypothetical protein